MNFCPTGCCAVMSTNETTPVFSQGEMSSKTVTDNDSDDEDESKLMSQPVWHSLSPSPNDNELTNINQGWGLFIFQADTKWNEVKNYCCYPVVYKR